MEILLLRHFESKKNINKSFSSKDNQEVLTEHGINVGKNVAQNIFDYIKNKKHVVERIYCADSIRAKQSAQIIANKIGVSIETDKNLLSNNSGQLLGKTENEAVRINPLFMEQLKLYRTGIFSSYDFVKVFEREDKHEFEQRVNNSMQNILYDGFETLKIVVLHHSSLTAFIIDFARKNYNYPDTFYGRVDCDLGNVFLLNDDKILLCNEPSNKLLSV